MELNQAKMNLSKTSVDLAAIQASVESLNKTLRKDKILVGRGTETEILNHRKKTHHNLDDTDVSLMKQVNFEAEQFKKMTEASRYEVMKAMAEIERTKNCIRMAEMRLNAAKKMEEAAKAVEAIAVAQRDGDNSSGFSSQEPDGITLSFQEYQALSQKAKQAEGLCKTKFIDTMEVPILEKFEESFNEYGSHQTNVVIEDSFSRTQGRVGRSGNNLPNFKFRNSHSGNRNAPDILNGNKTNDIPSPGFRSTTSIGDVLNRKVIVQDDVMMGRRVERQHVSLSQMLREQSRLILHPNKTSGEGNVQKQYFMQRKKFGFIQVPIPTKQSKKKAQANT